MKTLSISPGELVRHRGLGYEIQSIVDTQYVICVNESSKKAKELLIAELEPYEAPDEKQIDLSRVNSTDWDTACKRLEAILPLINRSDLTRKEVTKRAREFRVDTSTVYRWIDKYESSGYLSSLLPKRIYAHRGRKKLAPNVEEIIQQQIDEFYLTTQKPTIVELVERVHAICLQEGLDKPSPGAIRSRTQEVTQAKRLAKRKSPAAAKQAHGAVTGKFPGADYPLSVVQIDHTKLNIILVDEESRRPIGRPWLTVAIDVYSRMIFGYYIALEPPSAMSTGLALSNGICTKEAFLATIGVEADWPLWGIPQKVHADNAKEFRGNMLKRAAKELGFVLEWRPVKSPEYGSHIERYCGTLKQKLKNAPGTTFSNIAEREGYDSEKMAAFVMDDIERWVGTTICNIYHQKVHLGIGMSPLKQWEIGILGDDTTPGRGIPPKPTDNNAIRLALLPWEERTVQRTGIEMDGITYYADCLKPWIKVLDPRTNKPYKFTVRRDPRDISHIYFYDPERQEYLHIPYSNVALPSLNIWELRAAKKAAKERYGDINEVLIFKAHQELKDIEEKAVQATAKTRRKKSMERSIKKRTETLTPAPEKAETFSNEVTADDIKPFDDLGVWD